MSTGADIPPLLTIGDVLEFRGGPHLAAHLEGGLGQGRLMAIDAAQLPLFEPRIFKVRVAGQSARVEVPGQVVHRQSDVVGLALEVDAARLEAMRALAPPPPGRRGRVGGAAAARPEEP